MNGNKLIGVGHIIFATFLVAGTAIGGGMLALPVVTGLSGFVPSLVIMLFCWISMTITALLLLEVNLWMEEGAHFITMSKRMLGLPGQIVSWILYLFICYASLVAYTAGGGIYFTHAINSIFNSSISIGMGAVLFLVIFGIIVDLGSEVVGRVNAILFIGMIAAYFALVVGGLDEVKAANLEHQTWRLCLLAIPLTLTTFSFQTMVPSLTPYLKRHGPALRIAVIGGTTITFIVYAIWQWLILGIVPLEGKQGLLEAFALGEPATQFVSAHVQGRWIGKIAEYFAFLAIVTSFLGIGLGLVDFLLDGLHLKRSGKSRLLTGALIIIPTLIFATQFERVFLVAMELSGGIGDAILNGMIPVMMVWVGRYRLGISSDFKVGGGKPLLVATFAWFLFTLCVQIYALFYPMCPLPK